MMIYRIQIEGEPGCYCGYIDWQPIRQQVINLRGIGIDAQCIVIKTGTKKKINPTDQYAWPAITVRREGKIWPGQPIVMVGSPTAAQAA
jgi:hypothetical protein